MEMASYRVPECRISTKVREESVKCSARFSRSGMKRFHGKDEAYARWLAENPDGWVVSNYDEGPGTAPVLHRATCSRIGAHGGKPDSGESFTRSWEKVCFSGKGRDSPPVASNW